MPQVALLLHPPLLFPNLPPSCVRLLPEPRTLCLLLPAFLSLQEIQPALLSDWTLVFVMTNLLADKASMAWFPWVPIVWLAEIWYLWGD